MIDPVILKKMPRVVRSLLSRVVHEGSVRSYLRDGNGLDPGEFSAMVLGRLGISVTVSGAEHLRDASRPVVCANHPTGGIDGLALIYAIWRYHGAVMIPANDILKNVHPLAPVILPVVNGSATRNTHGAFVTAFQGSAPILVFPAGVTARMRGGRVREYPWRATFITWARRSGRTVVPVHISGKNSSHFYGIHAIRRALGITLNIEMSLLVDELFRRRGETVHITFMPEREILSTNRSQDLQLAHQIQKEVECLH